MVYSACVCGAGTMGSGIAQNLAAAGFPTILYELNPVVLDNAKLQMERNFQKMVDKGKMQTDEKAAALDRLVYTSDLKDCMADIIIEAIVEKLSVKTELFNQLAAINSPTTRFATNTSSLSVNRIASAISHPERFIGMHFFNPAPIMKLVEIVLGEQTDEDTRLAITALARSMGKIPVLCKDAPGFIVNRVARPFYIESLRLAEETGLDIETIDTVLEDRGFRMGPFRLMDLIGNDINYAVSVSVYEQMHQPERLKPSYIQKEKVEKGELGKKSGKGYYTY
ncbi:MAG: 3-hydroxybutyryl-CoA dehydrogenase [Terrimonas sp.]|nr:3-hydroxybutyryl-CoA dehydrogenase [Terrimonas sp.]